MTSEFLIFSGLKSSYEAACEEGQKKLLFFIQFQTFVFSSTFSHFSLFSLQSLSLPFFHLPSKLEHFEFPSAFQLLFLFSFPLSLSTLHLLQIRTWSIFSPAHPVHSGSCPRNPSLLPLLCRQSCPGRRFGVGSRGGRCLLFLNDAMF